MVGTKKKQKSKSKRSRSKKDRKKKIPTNLDSAQNENVGSETNSDATRTTRDTKSSANSDKKRALNVFEIEDTHISKGKFLWKKAKKKSKKKRKSKKMSKKDEEESEATTASTVVSDWESSTNESEVAPMEKNMNKQAPEDQEEKATLALNIKAVHRLKRLKKSKKSREKGDKKKSKEKGDKKKKKKRRKRKKMAEMDENQKPIQVFGYLSKLNPQDKQHLFKRKPQTLSEPSEPELNATSEERDMTWLQYTSPDIIPTNEPQTLDPKTRDSVENDLGIFWLFLFLGGRMPFYLDRNYDSDPMITVFTYRMKRKYCNYYAFVITTIFLIFVTLVSILNFILMISTDEITTKPHNQVEKLLLKNNMVVATIFLTSLIFVSISSINVLIYGESITKYLTIWAKTMNEFILKSSLGIKTVIIIYIVWSTSLFLIQLIVFSVTYSDPKPNPLIQATQMMTLIFFRSFAPNLLIKINEPEQLWKYGIFMIFLKSYVLYCSWNFLIMIVLYSIGIGTIANEWNFRLGLRLRQINTKKNEVFLLNVSTSLNYKKILDWHRHILVLVQENSKVFCTILVAFYLGVAIALLVEVHQLAIHVVGDNYVSLNINPDANAQLHEDFIYLCFYMFQTIGIFLFVSLFLAQAGIELMNALSHITRNNYMNLPTSRRRDFLMSLLMSFSPGKPHLLMAGRIFSIDRPFILHFFAFFLYLFAIMIQIQHPKMLNIPTIVECTSSSGSTQFCIANKLATMNEIETMNDLNGARSLDYLNLNAVVPTPSPVVVVVQTPTSTPPPPQRPDSCGNFPKLSNAIQKLVKSLTRLPDINNGDYYAFCCYDNEDGKLPNCNQNTGGDLLKNCRIDPSNHAALPFRFDDLAVNFQGCLNNPKPKDPNTTDECYEMHDCVCGVDPTKAKYGGTYGSIRCI